MTLSLIAAEDLGKSFGSQRVFTTIHLGVAEREVVCVIGPSGSGKTTLLRCMALLEGIGEGQVRLLGQCPKS